VASPRRRTFSGSDAARVVIMGQMVDGLANEGVQHAPRASGTVPTPSEAHTRSFRLHAMVTAHFDFVWRSLRRMGLQAADADDAAQEVFCILDRRLDDVEPGCERSFLFGTALRVVSLHRRSSRRRSARHEGYESMPDSSRTPLDPEQLMALRHARSVLDQLLDELPLEERAVFVLYELEELSVPEVAELCQLKVATAASRLRRARESFRAAARRRQAREQFADRFHGGDS
jgi:RNA polymerase sigma-70 factor (ECF subfamily)